MSLVGAGGDEGVAFRDPVEKLVEKSSSPAATKDEDDELLGTEVRATVHEASDCKVVFNASPTIWINHGVIPKSGCYNCEMVNK